MRMRRARGQRELLLKKDKGDSCERAARFFAALSNPIRLRILDTLAAKSCLHKSGCCCVGEINTAIDLPQPYISKHLKVLKECGVLDYRREGNRILYSFKCGEVFEEIMRRLGGYGNCCGREQKITPLKGASNS